MPFEPDFALEVSGLHWIEGEPEETDLCVHGAARVRLGEKVLVTPSAGDGWTLSAASLYLLRSLFRDHTADSRLGDHLIPCCGFTMWAGHDGNVVIVGCPSGIDWSVRHTSSGVTLESSPDGTVTVASRLWRDAVVRVADQVRAFYTESNPKRISDDETERLGYEAFWTEWERLRAAA